MKTMKKSFGILVAVFAFCLAFAVTAKVDAAEVASKIGNVAEEAAVAETMDVPTSNFAVTYISSDKTYAGISVAYVGGYTEVGIFDVYGNLVATDVCASYATFSTLTPNSIYIYRARNVDYDSTAGGYVPLSDWSAPKAFSTVKYSLKTVKGKKAFNVKAPKIAGVKNYKLYMSKKSDSGFKKIKVLKPGKKYKITKFKKSDFKFYKNYYIKIVPQLSSGIACEDLSLARFYIYKTYR